MLPDSARMRQQNYERLFEYMKDPYSRGRMDENYEKALTEAGLDYDEEEDESEELGVALVYREYADLMERGNHPISLGTFSKLNERGEALVHIFQNERDYALDDDPKKHWKTFRDKERIDFASIYTGVRPCSFNKPWIDIDDPKEISELCDLNKTQ